MNENECKTNPSCEGLHDLCEDFRRMDEIGSSFSRILSSRVEGVIMRQDTVDSKIELATGKMDAIIEKQNRWVGALAVLCSIPVAISSVWVILKIREML